MLEGHGTPTGQTGCISSQDCKLLLLNGHKQLGVILMFSALVECGEAPDRVVRVSVGSDHSAAAESLTAHHAKGSRNDLLT